MTEEKRIKVPGGDVRAALRQREEVGNKMTAVMFMPFLSPDLCFASSMTCSLKKVLLMR